MGNIGGLYADGRRRITELVRDLNEDQAATTVPTCPAWSVHDVVAHVAGVCADILAGNIGGVGTDPWTDAQVQARKGVPVGELVEEWAETGPQIEAMADLFPGRSGTQLVFDLTTHEHDIRTALARPGARDSAAIAASDEFLMAVGLGPSVTVRGLAPIEVRTELRSWVAGTGDAAAAAPAGSDETALRAAGDDLAANVILGGDPLRTDGIEPAGAVRLSAFELFRAMSGRRSFDQIRAYEWTVDPEPYLPAFQFGPFTVSAVPIDE
ncbi:MAG TPA: maleylpyruvate isomerase family mycothiol-dependent enzyme [Acidimicrobiales bacterium]|nr:maleylpyruvate isomerase family mycothiol-dependent enzyme [Acidimicrobiales bacterium]